MLTAVPMTIDSATNNASDENVQRISISLERLQSNFIVSLREYLAPKIEPNAVIEDDEDGEGKDEAEVEGDDNNTVNKNDNDQDSLSADEDMDPEGHVVEKKEKSGKKKRRSSQKNAPKVEDYDVEDPFIDDSEVGAVYESVFDLMMRGGDAPDEDISGAEEEAFITEDLPERERSSVHSKRAMSMKDFYVYRGPIEVEVVEKEFDEPKKKKKKKVKKTSTKKTGPVEKASQPAESQKQEEPSASKKSKKRKQQKTSSDDSIDSTESHSNDSEPRNAKKKKELSLTERLQQLEAELDEREGKAAEDIVVADLDEDVKSNVKKIYDIEKEVNRLEALDAFEKVKETAAKITDFDPLRFPTALRAPLERYILTCLKRDNDVLEEEALEQVSSLIPYSSQALRKLLLKKIFPLLMESLGQVRPEIIRTRIREEVSSILNSEPDTAKPITSDDQANPQPQSDGNELPEPTTPMKKTKKRKWSDDLKQLVFEYLKCASERSMLLRAIRANAEDPAPRAIPSSLSETALRRTAYRELLACWPEDGQWTMTSAELSRECSNWKKRYERALLKDHNVDIEQFAVIVEKHAAPGASGEKAQETIVVDVKAEDECVTNDNADTVQSEPPAQTNEPPQ